MQKHNIVILVCVVALACFLATTDAVQCRGDSGRVVDWWWAIKYPNSRSYSYTDSLQSSNALSPAPNSFSAGKRTMLSATLGQIYSNSSVSWGMYNDDPPDSKRKRAVFSMEALQKAHAKGIVAVDDTGRGFWLIHSVPEFPVSASTHAAFEYMDDRQTKFAQSFMCISMKRWSDFSAVGNQLQLFRPLVYGKSFRTVAQNSARSLYDALVNGKYTNAAVTGTLLLTSSAGKTFTSFAKTGAFGRDWDLYEELVAPGLQQDLQVMTWRQGAGGILSSNCSQRYDVNNINVIKINNNQWKYTASHSKWAISADIPSKQFVCSCGINRMGSQGNRGGGCLCFPNSSLHKSLYDGVIEEEPCPRT